MKTTLAKWTMIPAWFCASIVCAETATIVSTSSLYQRPTVQAPVVQHLTSGTSVDSLSRQGSWKQVTTPQGKTGWVRSYQVRSGNITTPDKKTESGGFFSGLANLSRKASGLFSSEKKDYSFQHTATIGVRGLSEEQIKNAKPNLKELKKMESFRISKRGTKKYARNGKLSAVKLGHLPASEAEK